MRFSNWAPQLRRSLTHEKSYHLLSFHQYQLLLVRYLKLLYIFIPCVVVLRMTQRAHISFWLNFLNLNLCPRIKIVGNKVHLPFLFITILRRFCQICFGSNFFRFYNNYFLQRKVISLTFNPQPGGAGVCVQQRQGGPVIPAGTGFPFHLTRLHTSLRVLRSLCVCYFRRELNKWVI